MDFITAQIKLYEDISILHTNYIKYLKELRDEKKHDPNNYNSINDNTINNNIINDPVLESDKENDIIWERIQRARMTQLNQENSVQIKENNISMPEFPKQLINSALSEIIDPPVKIHTSNMTSLDKQSENKDIDNNKPTERPSPLVTCISKYSQKKQDEIIKNIFLKAKSNIERLAELDYNIRINMDQEINTEADKLLAAYLANN